MREIKEIIVHCSATNKAMDIGYREIDEWHKQAGFSKIGYHYIIRRDGEMELGRDLGEVGAHCRGHNAKSIGICLVGGIDIRGNAENNFTEIQFAVLSKLIRSLQKQFPDVKLYGHRDFANKECPCFDIQTFMESV